MRLAGGVAARMPRMRVVSRMTPAPLVWSLIASTWADARKDVADLADDAVGGNHRHIAVQAVAGALVEIEDAGLIAAAGADGLRGEGRINVLLLKAEECLQALALAGIFEQGSLLQAQPVDGLAADPCSVARTWRRSM